ncbi:MAG: pitrilysin family protein [Acidobacteriota bacterium]|nr:pitrilysin family protein [Acidobacteriota bacterium]NLT33621.1 insulinase family protein [Acidobacteriota bacterium]
MMQQSARVCLSFIVWMFGASMLFGQGEGAVPPHPRDIVYQPLEYTPPKAADHRRVLAGGVEAFFVEDHDLPLVHVSAYIRMGAYLDPAGKEGLAAAVGSQLRLGGTTGRRAEEFDEEADFLAADLASSVGSTAGRASVNFMAKDTDRALALFFDMLRRPAFQQDRLDLYKGQQLQAMERRNDQTGEIEGREWNRLLFGESHFSNRYGTRASISSLTREDLADFHRRYVHPGNLVLAVSGDFRTAEMKGALERAMAGWENTGVLAPPVPAPDADLSPGIYMVDKPDVNQARVSLGHRGIRRGDPDEIVVDVMNDILGGSGFTSRIMSRVRTEEGLAYDTGSRYSAGIYYPGEFRAWFQTRNASAARAARIVIEEIERMRRTKVEPEELETVKNQAVEIFPRVFATARATAETFAADAYTGRDPLFWDTYRDRVRAVTVDDVHRAAGTHLHPERLVILAVGNVDEVLRGDPERPEDSFGKMGRGDVVRVPLPDPMTMEYPK